MKLTTVVWSVLVFVRSFQFGSGKGISLLSNKGNATTRNYDFELTAFDTSYVNPAYFGNSTFFKRTGPNTFSYNLDILQDLPADTVTAYKSFEKNMRNEYVPSIVVKGTICEDYRKEILKVPMFVCQRFQAGGIKECPFKKGRYSLDKAECTSADGPPVAPGRYWRLDFYWLTNNNVLLLKRSADFTILRKKRS